MCFANAIRTIATKWITAATKAKLSYNGFMSIYQTEEYKIKILIFSKSHLITLLTVLNILELCIFVT